MRLAGMVRTTLLDFPGRLACVLFTSGCPYSCFYCHNRIALTGGAAGVSAGTAGVSLSQAMDFLHKRRGLLDGVVVSGGEPTIHPELEEVIDGIKEMGYDVKLDTCGCNPSVVARLLKRRSVDYIALDVKAPWGRYREICGGRADPDAVQDTLSLLQEAPAFHWEARTTVAPTLGLEDLQEIASQMPCVPTWRLNLYRIPENYLTEDSPRVNAPAPSLLDLQRWTPRLKLLQPNLLDPE